MLGRCSDVFPLPRLSGVQPPSCNSRSELEFCLSQENSCWMPWTAPTTWGF